METTDSKYIERYWLEFEELETQTIYLDLLARQDEKWDKSIKFILALTSSGSISTWIIWQKHSIIWASIIAASQVINVIKQFLPFENRLKEILRMLPKMEELSCYTECHLYNVFEGILTEKEINDLRFKIKARKAQILNKYFPNGTWPDKKRLMEKAQKLAAGFFDKYYPSKRAPHHE